MLGNEPGWILLAASNAGGFIRRGCHRNLHDNLLSFNLANRFVKVFLVTTYRSSYAHWMETTKKP